MLQQARSCLHGAACGCAAMIAAEAVDKFVSAGPEATEQELVLLGIMFDQAVCFLQAML